MTDAAVQARNAATVAPEAMAWDRGIRRLVFIYLPLVCFVFILLFPFYWMVVTTFKPNAELYNYKTYNPFWIAQPTLDHVYRLLFQTDYPRWLTTTMMVAIGATTLSLFACATAATPSPASPSTAATNRRRPSTARSNASSIFRPHVIDAGYPTTDVVVANRQHDS